MSDTGLTVPGMIELPRRYDVTVTVDRNDSHSLNPAEFAVAAEQAASARAASIASAHTAREIVSSVTSPSWPQISPRPLPSPWSSSPAR